MLQKFVASLLINLKHRGLRLKVNELEKSEFWTPIVINEFQNRKLRNLIIHAYNQVPYYKFIFESQRLKPSDIQTVNDLYKIPILEKDTIQKNQPSMISLNHKSYYTRTTTGSTGVPLCIKYDYNNKLIEIALMQRFIRSIGKELGAKEINLWGRPDRSFSAEVNRVMKKLIYNIDTINAYNLTEEKIYDILHQLTLNPNIHLRGFTNVIYLLACKLQEIGTKINVDAVSVTAEKLLRSQREVIENYLTKNLYDQYGCGEVNSIAFECCKHEGLHHAFEHSILELTNKNEQNDSESGEAVITNLDNFLMPLIRYRNGDLITLAKHKCSCGRSSKLIKSIDGRLYDFIEGANGRKIHSAFLDHILVDANILFKYTTLEIRIIQTNLDQINIQYVANEIIPEDEFNEIKHEINRHLGHMKTTITKKCKISESINGKRKFVVPYSDFISNKNIL